MVPMTLSWPIALAVLFGALLHAGWNALVKSSQDKALDTALLNLIAGVLALPLLALAGWPVTAAWPWIAASTLVHVGYYSLLTAAYRHGELALTYPLMRGAAPLLVALLSVTAFGEDLSPAAWVGVLAVCGGVLVLGLSRHGLDSGRAVALALANAVVIAAYTLIDGHGVRASGNAVGYVACLFLVNAVPFGAIVVARRGWVERIQPARSSRGGACSSWGPASSPWRALSLAGGAARAAGSRCAGTLERRPAWKVGRRRERVRSGRLMTAA